MPGLRRLRSRPKRSDGPRRGNARSHRLSKYPQVNEGQDGFMVANSALSGCPSGRARCAPPFPWSDMALLWLVTIGAVLTGLCTFVTASSLVASGFELLGYPQMTGSVLLRLFAVASGAAAMWEIGLSAAHKLSEMRGSSAFVSRKNLITHFAATAVAMVMGGVMWWLTHVESGWRISGVDYLLLSEVAAVLIPVVLVWVVVARLVHRQVSK